MYIVVEGGEGSGKSTTIESLKKIYPNAIFVSEPGGTSLGKELKKQIFNQKREDITDVYLFATARAELIATIVAPALAEGKTVISDRSFITSLVYQGIIGGLGTNLVLESNMHALQNCIPDKVIYFRTSYETSRKRATHRKDDGGESNYYDTAGQQFFESVDQGYMSLAGNEIPKEKFIIIDANKENPERVEDMKKIIGEI